MKKDNGIITPNGEKPQYDFAFIATSLGLFAINGLAFNLGAISLFEATPKGAMLAVHGEHEIELSHEQLAELQAAILARIAAMEAAKSGKAPAIVLPDFVMKGK